MIMTFSYLWDKGHVYNLYRKIIEVLKQKTQLFKINRGIVNTTT